MSDELVDKKCKPCEGGVPPLEPAVVKQLLQALHALATADHWP